MRERERERERARERESDIWHNQTDRQANGGGGQCQEEVLTGRNPMRGSEGARDGVNAGRFPVFTFLRIIVFSFDTT